MVNLVYCTRGGKPWPTGHIDQVQFGDEAQLPFAGGAFSDGTNKPFDARPAASTFSPIFKGRTLGLEVAMDF